MKNALVIAAAGAAGALGHDDVPLRVGLAFVAFCLLASGVYAINDVRDASEDRAHPRKRLRPVAAGELDPGAATALGVALMLAGLALCVGDPAAAARGRRRLPRADAQLHGALAADRRARHRRDRLRLRAARGRRRRRGAGAAVALVHAGRHVLRRCSSPRASAMAELQRNCQRRARPTRRPALLHNRAAAADPPQRCRVRAVRLLRLGVRAAERRRGPVAAADDHPVRRVPGAIRRAGAGGATARRRRSCYSTTGGCSSPGSPG